MLYVKTNISSDVQIKVDLYDDEIYTQCPKCGKEMQVETEVLKQILEDSDLASSSLYCEKCSKEVST